MALQDPWVAGGCAFSFTEATPGALYKHLRRFLLVRDTEGSENDLRFDDPRVLQPFFASSSDAERRQFFGPIRRLLAYDPEASEAADKIVLRQWNPPLPAAEAAEARPPSATDMFRLSKQHETVFDKDCMERYDKRCIKLCPAIRPSPRKGYRCRHPGRGR